METPDYALEPEPLSRVFNVQPTSYSVGDFLGWQRTGGLRLSPSFQRRPVWSKKAKSFLVDSMVRGLPVPVIYLRGRVDLGSLESQREVVDGQQRLRTIFAFIDPASLQDYEPARDSFTVQRTHNRSIYGKPFGRLAEAVKRQLLNYRFSVVVLPPETDDREVLQIFARLNSTGMRLNAQELRNAEYFGEFKTQAYEMAYEQLARWRRWQIFDETSIARMNEVELTSDLMLLIIEGVRAKTQAAITRAYKLRDEAFPEQAEVWRRFNSVMDEVDDTVGYSLHTLEFARPPLFYTLFSYFYDLMFGLGSGLQKRSPGRMPHGISKGVSEASYRIESGHIDEELRRVLRGATADRRSREIRLAFLKGVCEGGAA